MFSYYGRKSKLASHYPKPEHDSIIEPFCGSAAYSLHGDNWQRNVMLYDCYDVIVNLWRYLQCATEQDILSLPDIRHGETVDTHTLLTTEERHLIGFCINNGSASPKRTSGKMNFNSWHRDKPRIARDLHKIRHWHVALRDYADLADAKASWFIDPPYQHGAVYYRFKAIDYNHLANWCRTRSGQVLVCENSKATWMNFEPLATLSGQRHKTTEVIWSNNQPSQTLAA